MKEKRKFFIRLVIEKKDDGKIIDLSKQQELEINFWGSEGKIVGKKKNEVVLEFEKNGKKFQVLMKIDKIKKGWFKDEIIGCVFEPFPREKIALYKNPSFIKRTWYGIGYMVRASLLPKSKVGFETCIIIRNCKSIARDCSKY